MNADVKPPDPTVTTTNPGMNELLDNIRPPSIITAPPACDVDVKNVPASATLINATAN